MDNENVVASPLPTAEKKPNQIIRYAIMGVIGVVVLAVVIAIISALIPAKFSIRDGNTINNRMNDNDEYVFIFNGKKMVEISDDITKEMDVDSIDTDYNKQYALFLTVEDAEDEDSEGGDLYVVNNKKAVKAHDEVTEYYLSAFGTSFLFIADGDLYYGQLKNPAKAAKVDSDVDSVVSVSPNGKAFAYSKIDEDDEEVKTDYYISTNGKKGEKFGKKNASIFSISDGAKYVYYAKDEKVYVNDTKLADADKTSEDTFIFNRDGSQLIFSASTDKGDIKTYFVSKAKSKVAIANGFANGVICPTGASSSNFYNTSSLIKCAIRVFDDVNMESLSFDSSYYYLKNAKGDAEKISAMKNASDIQMLDDCKTVLYIKGDNLRKIKINKPNSEPKEYEGADEDLLTFDATNDGEHIYVLDTDGTLYYVKSASKVKKIKDDVSYFYTTEDGKVYFVNDDDELYYATKSGSAKQVKSDVESFSYSMLSDTATAVCDGDFGVVSGKKFKKLFSVD